MLSLFHLRSLPQRVAGAPLPPNKRMTQPLLRNLLRPKRRLLGQQERHLRNRQKYQLQNRQKHLSKSRQHSFIKTSLISARILLALCRTPGFHLSKNWADTRSNILPVLKRILAHTKYMTRMEIMYTCSFSRKIYPEIPMNGYRLFRY